MPDTMNASIDLTSLSPKDLGYLKDLLQSMDDVPLGEGSVNKKADIRSAQAAAKAQANRENEQRANNRLASFLAAGPKLMG